MAKGSRGGKLTGGGGGGNVGVTVTNAGGGGPTPVMTRRTGWGVINGRAVQPQMAPASSQNADGWTDMTDTAATLLRRQMGQTGNEAGLTKAQAGNDRSKQMYVASAKSYLVNNALRSDMQQLTGSSTDPHIQASVRFWLNNGYTMKTAASTIKTMDAGMKPMTHDAKFVRYDGESILSMITGKQGITVSQLSRMSPTQVNNLFAGKVTTDKGYSSASWRMDPYSSRDAAYMAKPVKWEYSVQTGVQAIVTNNTTEHEVVIGRGYDKVITGARVQNGQLVISANIYNDSRSGYYKVN